jgi:hypothetical protein
MDERRDQQADVQPARLPIATANSRLSPVQQAYAAYTGHAIHCDACRDVDRTCPDAAQLWTAYQQVADNAFSQLADGTR